VFYREELKAAQDEIDRVKDEYCNLCGDTQYNDNNLHVFYREELKAAQDEIDRVKDEYCNLCGDMEKMKAQYVEEHTQKLNKAVEQVGPKIK